MHLPSIPLYPLLPLPSQHLHSLCLNLFTLTITAQPRSSRHPCSCTYSPSPSSHSQLSLPPLTCTQNVPTHPNDHFLLPQISTLRPNLNGSLLPHLHMTLYPHDFFVDLSSVTFTLILFMIFDFILES